VDKRELKFPTFESFQEWFDRKTENHPFKLGTIRGRYEKDFAEGKVPIEFMREYARQFYLFIQLTNTNVTWTLINYMDLWRKYPELYEIVAAKVGSELSDPAPGGHGRTYVKFARYLGVKDEELFSARPIPELEARLNTTIAYRSQSPAMTAVRWMLEGFVGYLMKHSRAILHEQYGIPDEMLEYFDIHIAADLEEHGPEGAMMLEKLYKVGLVSEEDQEAMRVQVERNVEGTQPGSQTYTWADILYDRYRAQHGV